MNVRAEELTALERAIEGRVVLGDSPDHAFLRQPAWAQYEHIRPEAVVLCRAPEDVAETIAVARRLGLEAVARSGGHCFAGRSSTRGIVIDLSEMRSVSVVDGIATVGAGAQLEDVYEHLEPLGLTIAAGACPSVGIAGLTLGGGLGILGRRYGLTSDQLVEAEVVVADGRILECDDDRHAELFWALRGAGGGQFGIVTRFAFRTVPADDVTCFALAWPFSQAAAVIDAWQRWAPDAPDELAASLLVNASSDLPEPVVTVFGAMIAVDDLTARTLDELVVRARAGPTSTTLEQMSHGAAKRYLAEHAPGVEAQDDAAAGETARPTMLAKSAFFREPLPPDAIAALLEAFAARRSSGQARELDFTPWGGAYNRTPLDATAFVHRNERFLLKHAVVLGRDAARRAHDAGRDWLAGSWASVERWSSAGVFPNFPDPDLADWTSAYHGANYERLTRIKAAYDPDNVFRFHQSVHPAGA